MKKVTMKESSYDMLKERILENKFDDTQEINEISHGAVERAYDRADDLFDDVRTSFEDFYATLNNALFNAKHNSKEGQDKGNIYLTKIKEYSDAIYSMLSKKKRQQNMFHDETMNKFDYNKFYDDKEKPEEWEENYDDLDLRMLQQRYPKN